MKKNLLTLLGGLSAVGVNAQTLQTVTDNGKVSTSNPGKSMSGFRI
jgi:hypothetical protein